MKRLAVGWPLRISAAAADDYRRIIDWTAQQWGGQQARVYAATLDAAIAALMDGPQVAGARSRPDIGRDLSTLHVQRAGRKGRHFVIFRIGTLDGKPCIDVLRLLHDAMDLPRHFTDDPEGEPDV